MALVSNRPKSFYLHVASRNTNDLSYIAYNYGVSEDFGDDNEMRCYRPRETLSSSGVVEINPVVQYS
jgi:hypothetical protein